MAIEFRDVTQLEPLEALEDGDYLVVVRDGVAKRISKAARRRRFILRQRRVSNGSWWWFF